MILAVPHLLTILTPHNSGNHDLDFGLREFRALKVKCNFPWLCSNALDANTDEPLGGCEEYVVLDRRDEGGVRLLVVGLVEDAWLDTLATIDPSHVVFELPVEYVRQRVPELQRELGPFDAVVAATHMRMPNDLKLAREAGGDVNNGVDIILGGNDHHYEDDVENGVRVLNSGCDFKCYTVLDVKGRDCQTGKLVTYTSRVDVKASDSPDEGVVEAIRGFKEAVDKIMDVVVGRTNVALDARFAEIRRRETNIGNCLAELMTRGTGADIALLNSGMIRADRMVGPGALLMRDLSKLLVNELAVIEVTAERLLLALENGVSQYPAMEGRFPCVDGVRFSFDPSKPAGSRVVPESVYVRDRPLVVRRHTLMRGQPANGTEAVKNDPNSSHEKVQKNGAGGAPEGFSPLDPGRKYSLMSKAYLAIEGRGLSWDTRPAGWTLEIWRGLTVRGTVLRAASKLKKLANKSLADPFAISPKVDGRIRNLAEGA
ncbi:hypothetical protein ACHAWF_002771 [Thalassiosira exigua]